MTSENTNSCVMPYYITKTLGSRIQSHNFTTCLRVNVFPLAFPFELFWHVFSKICSLSAFHRAPGCIHIYYEKVTLLYNILIPLLPSSFYQALSIKFL
ncbi:hypothetical protein HOLleu_22956 [Holothuria leucospilota]|uniref:Uncharacterized protein n=1 Tax=Holothuria leucospilota TaxID=206669 RepID=A0A9Q1H4T1_HOLLE|nr:hypothetical protein HOLleu_22956 [Holothuria leucospilota]